LIIITLILLPGTIVHELSHFIAALLLLLPVRSISVLPVFEDREIKLGEVRFERRDFFRAGLVGVAPLFLGILFLLSVFYFQLFPGDGIFYNLFIAYVIFSVSSNMFSSRHDLKDVIYLIPVMVLIFLTFYLFDIKLDMTLLNDILNKVNHILIYVLVINGLIFVSLKTYNYFIKK